VLRGLQTPNNSATRARITGKGVDSEILLLIL
jgi:hypothetical protein